MPTPDIQRMFRQERFAKEDLWITRCCHVPRALAPQDGAWPWTTRLPREPASPAPSGEEGRSSTPPGLKRRQQRLLAATTAACGQERPQKLEKPRIEERLLRRSSPIRRVSRGSASEWLLLPPGEEGRALPEDPPRATARQVERPAEGLLHWPLRNVLRAVRPRWRVQVLDIVVIRLRNVGIVNATALKETLDSLGQRLRQHHLKPLSRSTVASLRKFLGVSHGAPRPDTLPGLPQPALSGKCSGHYAGCSVFSMGHYCMTADFLKQIGVRKEAYPTDYSAVTLNVWCRMLADNFETLLTPKGSRHRGEHPYNSPQEYVAMFIHQKGWANDKTHRRVERLRRVLGEKRAFGVSIIVEGKLNLVMSRQEILRDAVTIATHNEGFRHIVVVWLHEQVRGDSTANMWSSIVDRVSLLEYWPRRTYNYEQMLQASDSQDLLRLFARRFGEPFLAAVDEQATAQSGESSGSETEEYWDLSEQFFDPTAYIKVANRSSEHEVVAEPTERRLGAASQCARSAAEQQRTRAAARETEPKAAEQAQRRGGECTSRKCEEQPKQGEDGAGRGRLAVPTCVVPAPSEATSAEEWVLVFRQDGMAWQGGPCPSYDAERRYSCMSVLEQYRDRATGKFCFKMVFKYRPRPNWNIWLQSTNPSSIEVYSGGVAGFEAIDLSYDRDDERRGVFHGLQKSRHPQLCLYHNYDPADPARYWYCLGHRWSHQFPGANGEWRERSVELYVRSPT